MEFTISVEGQSLGGRNPEITDPSLQATWVMATIGEWRLAMRFQHRDGRLVLTELRVFPSEAPPPNDAWRETGEYWEEWEWSGRIDSVVEGGLSATFLRSIALGRLRDQAIAIFRDPQHPAWGPTLQLDADDPWYTKYWPDPAVENWAEAVIELGVDQTVPQEASGPGHPPHPEELYALTAYYYVEGLAHDLPIRMYIRQQIRTLLEGDGIPGYDDGVPNPTQIGRWIWLSRDHYDYLSDPPTPRTRGGVLKPKVWPVLARLGIYPPTATDSKETE